jgi:DNA-binding MarR family transcriptional regulator
MTIKPYLKENIDDHVTIKPWDDKNIFPVFLRDIYNFYEMTILDTTCIVIKIVDDAPSVDVLQRHIKRIKELTNQQIILYYNAITRYRRKSLIENRIPFIVEDGQMYMPFLGLDLKKASPQYIEKEIKTFSTSTQLAYLYFLYNKDEVINATGFADKMGFTLMTASRALNALYSAKLLIYEVGGKTSRSKDYRRIQNPEYFQKGHEFIKSPIKKLIYVKRPPEGALIAGLDALAELSMMNSPGHPIRAISSEELNKQELEIIQNKDIIKDEKLVELEVWDYDPRLFSDKKHVDLMSLYASLKGENDERVEQALEEILRGETWYTD